MANHNLPARRLGRDERLRLLFEEALRERRRRLHSLDAVPLFDADGGPRRRAAHLVVRMLSSRCPSQGDAARFFELLANRLQLASTSIGTMMTAVAPIAMMSRRMRALAVVVADVVHFIETCAAQDASLKVYVALGFEDGQLVLGVGAEGEMVPAGSASAARGWRRASAIVQLLGGEAERGVDGERMVFGMTFPAGAAS